MLRACRLGDAVIAASIVALTPSVASCRVPHEPQSLPATPHTVYVSWDELMDDVRQGRVRSLVRGGKKLHGALYPEDGEVSSTFEVAGVLEQAVPEDDWHAIRQAGVSVPWQIENPNRWFWVANYWLAPVMWLLLLAACIVRWNDANGWTVAFFTGGVTGVLLSWLMRSIAAWGGGSDPTRINWRFVEAGIWSAYAGMVCAGVGGVLSILSSVKRLRSAGAAEQSGDA